MHEQPLFPVQVYSQFLKHVKYKMFPLDLARCQTIKRVIQASVSRGDLAPFERVFYTYVSCDVLAMQASDSYERFIQAFDACAV